MQHTDRASDGGNGGLALHAEAQRLAAAEAVLQGVRSEAPPYQPHSQHLRRDPQLSPAV